MGRCATWALFFITLLTPASTRGQEVAPARPLVVAVLPLDLEQGPSSYTWMRSALPGILEGRLLTFPNVRTVETAAVYAAASTVPGATPGQIPEHIERDVAMNLGASLGADVVLWGDTTRFGDRVTVDISLTAVGTGLDVVHLQKKGSLDDLPALLSQLSLELATGLGVEPNPELTTSLEKPGARDRYTLVLWGRGLNDLFGVGTPVDLAKAETNLEHSLRIDPELAHAWYTLGVCQFQLGDESGLVTSLEQALNLRPADPHSHRRLAHLALAQAQPVDAEAHLIALVKLTPEDASAHLELANTLEHLDKSREALVEGEAAVKAPLTTPEIHVAALRLLASLRAQAGDLPGMASAWNEILKTHPLDREAHLALGALALSRGDLDTAADHYRTLREADRTDPIPLHFLGEIGWLRGRYTEAADRFKSEAELSRASPTAWRYVARAATSSGDTTLARTSLENASRLRPGDAMALNALAAERLEAGDTTGALAALDLALVSSPGLALLHVNRGITLIKKGNLADARTALNQALLLDDRLPSAHYHLSVIEIQEGDPAGALEQLSLTLAIDPGFVVALYNTALLLEQKGDKARAATAWEDYLRAAPQDPRKAQLQAHINLLRGQ